MSTKPKPNDRLLAISIVTNFVLVIYILFIGAVKFFADRVDHKIPRVTTSINTNDTYIAGINDAMNTVILLDLELALKNERKTWAQMRDIVRDRLISTLTNQITGYTINRSINE
jgi:hypothetical protein